MIFIILILLLACFHVTMIDYLYHNPDYYQLDAYTWESDDFRSMKLGELVASQNQLDYDVLTTLMVEHQYDLTRIKDLSCQVDRLASKRPVDYRKLRNAYKAVFQDLRYFPIPESLDPRSPPVAYENGWMDKRTYGGERGHEGCDMMGTKRPRGYYPVASITDGVVEKVGWLEKGGWRLGIRAPGGAYLYYAHLYQYAREWKEGDKVQAGDLLGFMGDSGYGTAPGTVGNFQVHLHLGIYLKTDHYQEMSINPYWILRYLEKHKLKYWY